MVVLLDDHREPHLETVVGQFGLVPNGTADL
jgi:hypothetical protein